ncbi:MAG: hypothetical protein A2817_03230 [Candidatus Yanofskybacteria bacterium RIFCSPHIGHO2_01_FULL_39_8b]|uniref:Uncharacterized protein n=1 Tax=Candidatus Yanofskybacteria bacterium RIFCSPHIGHO2_01_FULL_39_8b TaxID=1802659 RepID=A0A1F8EDH3_9BACT|nr:MAG: hypothetical protein A2817_03230 [Candidatus Yanofskybacteria bacterium RIFCSPHIGHO2_01_FULL_39_8b]
MQNLKLKILFLSFLLSVKSLTASAGIITDNLGGAPGAVFKFENLLGILRGVSCWFLRFGIIAVGVMMVVYGILFLVSRGNPTGMTNAKKALSWGIVGGLVIFGVFTIILTVPELLKIVGSTTDDPYPIMKILNNCL